MAEINADKDVMEFFPSLQSLNQTIEFIERMNKQLIEKKFCYFAVDKIENGEFIGFIGLSEQTFKSEFTPCIDIGWRINKSEWNKGFATEGAKRCLDYAFNQLNLNKVNSLAPKLNLKSEQIMKKIGMKKILNFKHPMLETNKRLNEFILYEITK